MTGPCCRLLATSGPPHTLTDPEVAPLFEALPGCDGIRVGVLSNTVWPRSWHEEPARRPCCT